MKNNKFYSKHFGYGFGKTAFKYVNMLLLALIVLFSNNLTFANTDDTDLEHGEIDTVFLAESLAHGKHTRMTSFLASSFVQILESTTRNSELLSNAFINFINPLFITNLPDERYSLVSAKDGKITLRSKVHDGDSASILLNDWLSMAEIIELDKASKDIHPITSLRVGQSFYLVLDAKTSELERFEYEIDTTKKLIADLSNDEYNIYTENIPYEIVLEYVAGTITSNFYNSVIAVGENPNFAFKLAQVFAYDIDFFSEIQKNDTFKALMEKRYRDGKFIGYGRILGATFSNKGEDYHAYLYFDPEDSEKTAYFNEEGKALQKAFLRTPVEFTRVSSGYTMNRKHPILGITRPHQGIDYAAPTGTPVIAVADGVIERSSYNGGYGHFVKIKHSNSLHTQYAHLSKYGKGIKKGVKVRQGQIIGYVGSTGLSTGPHLDFRIQKNGKFVNPDKVIVPAKEPIKSDQLQAYTDTVVEIKNLMAEKAKRENYNASLWLNGIR